MIPFKLDILSRRARDRSRRRLPRAEGQGQRERPAGGGSPCGAAGNGRWEAGQVVAAPPHEWTERRRTVRGTPPGDDLDVMWVSAHLFGFTADSQDRADGKCPQKT